MIAQSSIRPIARSAVAPWIVNVAAVKPAAMKQRQEETRRLSDAAIVDRRLGLIDEFRGGLVVGVEKLVLDVAGFRPDLESTGALRRCSWRRIILRQVVADLPADGFF
jgi:hypothetical protein